MRWLIDGYNVIRRDPDLAQHETHNLEDGRAALLRLVAGAARASGASNVRIMVRHVLPNVAAPVIIIASVGFGQFILAEASLSFLGYGVPPPEPSWGGMLASEGRAYMYAATYMFLAPALALSIVVFGVNMFGDAIRDVLDPRLRGTGK